MIKSTTMYFRIDFSKSAVNEQQTLAVVVLYNPASKIANTAHNAS